MSWLELPSGKAGISYGVNFTGPGRVRAEVYLYKGEKTFPDLLKKKDEIEVAFGEPLQWEELPERVASRIAVYRDGDVAKEQEWPVYTKWLLEQVGRMRNVFKPYIDAL